MASIITYDLSGAQSQIKKDMIDNKGYRVSFNHTNNVGKSGTVYLPETTLYHSNKTPKQAHADLIDSCLKYSCSIRRAIAVELSSWSAEWGTEI